MKKNRVLLLILIFSSIQFFLFQTVLSVNQETNDIEMKKARNGMEEALMIIREARLARGIPLVLEEDPNRTGIIGFEYSDITTTPGDLEAKRSTTNPDMAALMILFFKEIGLKTGDVIAIGSSASFPALFIASISACESMGIIPLSILSLTASEWGANIPDFNLLEMIMELKKSGKNAFFPLAVSIGGEEDTGRGLSAETLLPLERSVEKALTPLIRETDFYQNVLQRMEIYQKNAQGKEIKAFINIGGASANVGKDALFLYLKPGINRVEKYPPPETGGVLYLFARKGIPIIHLLYIKGLVMQNGLPWDPIPIPSELQIRKSILSKAEKAWLVVIFVLFWCTILFFRSFFRCTLLEKHTHRFFDR